MDQRYTQSGRPLSFAAEQLEADALLLERFRGSEGISRLFHFTLDLLAPLPHDAASLAKVLGANCTVTVSQAVGTRTIHGMISRLTRGEKVSGPSGQATFVRYHAEIVPHAWLLTKRVHSRVFQDHTVPQILEEVFRSLPCLRVAMSLHDSAIAKVPHRPFCVQYRESDFAFVSRLMEEEGLWYFFRDEDGADVLCVTDAPAAPPELPTVVFEEGPAVGFGDGNRVRSWSVTQAVCTEKHEVGDRHFQVFGHPIESHESVPEQIEVDEAVYRFRHRPADGLAVEDDSASFAHHFDQVPSNAPKPSDDKSRESQSERDFNKLFDEPSRLARLRAQREAVQSLAIDGSGDCARFTPGFQFRVERNPEALGAYLLTAVEHDADLTGVYTGVGTEKFRYENHFQAVPFDAQLPYRPEALTPRPIIAGPQTAVVVGYGSKDDVVCPDRYGRIKVKFQWDRQQASDTRCSCWVRVGQVWAGKRWGAFFWPRVGHEVIVDFQDGDPDRPIVVGSAYNDTNMPPFTLPDHALFNGIKSCSARGDPQVDFNGFVFHDAKGHEELVLHTVGHLYESSDHDTLQMIGGHFHSTEAKTRIEFEGGLPSASPSNHSSHKDNGGNGAESKREAKENEEKGDESDYALTYDSASTWTWANKAREMALALAPTITFETAFGIEGSALLGWGPEYSVGSVWKMAVDPVSLADEFGLTAKVGVSGPIPSVGGDWNFTVGANTRFVYGPDYSCVHGKTVSFVAGEEADEKYPLTRLARLLARIQGLLTLSSVLSTSTEAPERIKPWDISGGAGLGVLTLLTGGLLMRAEIQSYLAVSALKEADKAEYAPKEAIVAILDETLKDLAELDLQQSAEAVSNLAESQGLVNTSPDATTPLDKESPGHETVVDGRWSVQSAGAELLAYNAEPLITIKALTAVAEGAPSGIAGAGKGGILLSADGGVGIMGGALGTSLANTLPTAPITVGSETMTTGELSLKQGLKTIAMTEDEIAVDASILGGVKVIGREITLEAEESITIRAGQNSITLEPTGIKISGLMVEIISETLCSIDARALKVEADTATAQYKTRLMTISD